MSKTVTAQGWATPEAVAANIASTWHEWNSQRHQWADECAELREFIFATDTRKTSAGKLGWQNSTTTPKLTQIRDNLHANYATGLFPNDDWLRWEAYDRASLSKDKRNAIQAYMSNKARTPQFRKTISNLLYDYIDFGVAFGWARYEESFKVTEDGDSSALFLGPVAERIDPMNIVMNPVVKNFEDSPVIIRELISIGDLLLEADKFPAESTWRKAAAEAVRLRMDAGGWKAADSDYMNRAYHVDGFGNYQSYLQSNTVELLRFYGDYFDMKTGQLHRDSEIIVIDRRQVVSHMTQPQWGRRHIHMTGWRKRPGNLWAQGPLANLVGMQYRIDHLENMKADVFDMIAYPVIVRKGGVSQFDYGPGAEVELDEDGAISFLTPPTTVLQANNEIGDLMAKMEEFAGAPREAMGIRSPGEKTAYEVQQLVTASGRIFQEKLTNFEIELLEPLLNSMLLIAKQYLNYPSLVSLYDDELGVQAFIEVTREDLTANGVLRPIGARHFSVQAQTLQNLTQLMNTQLGAKVAPHVHGWKVAEMLEVSLGLDRFNIFEENAIILEQASAAKMQALVQEQVARDLEMTQGVQNAT